MDDASTPPGQADRQAVQMIKGMAMSIVRECEKKHPDLNTIRAHTSGINSELRGLGNRA